MLFLKEHSNNELRGLVVTHCREEIPFGSEGTGTPYVNADAQMHPACRAGTNVKTHNNTGMKLVN